MSLKQYKVTVTLNGEQEEVPVWADSLDDALEWAEEEYGEVDRVRPVVTPQ